MNITRRCPNCGKYYFYLEGKPCPHCGKKENNPLNIFKHLFGDNNPFNRLGGT